MAWTGILHALWVFLPAYVANMSPVVMAKLIPGWKSPVDGGRMHKDGQRVLGPGKTWRGLVGGALFGGLTALAVAFLAPSFPVFEGWDFGLSGYPGGPIGSGPACGGAGGEEADCAWPPGIAEVSIFLFGAAVGYLALVGDAVKSFFKRRRQKERGAPWFPFDQLDFVVFGLVGMVVAAPLLPDAWIREALLGDWLILTTLIVLTPALHYAVNVIGYFLRLKEVPW